MYKKHPKSAKILQSLNEALCRYLWAILLGELTVPKPSLWYMGGRSGGCLSTLVCSAYRGKGWGEPPWGVVFCGGRIGITRYRRVTHMVWKYIHVMLQPNWGIARLECRWRSWQAAISCGEVHVYHGSADCLMGLPVSSETIAMR